MRRGEVQRVATGWTAKLGSALLEQLAVVREADGTSTAAMSYWFQCHSEM